MDYMAIKNTLIPLGSRQQYITYYYLKVFCPDMTQICDSHEEADCVQNIAFPGPIETGDSVKGGIKTINLDSLTVRLEAFYDHGLDEHGETDLKPV